MLRGYILTSLLFGSQHGHTAARPAEELPHVDVSVSRPTAHLPPTIPARGAHHRVWQSVVIETNHMNRIVRSTNSIIELESGMHYRRNGQWLETKEQIEIVPSGAIATEGPHQVSFAANVNSQWTVELLTPDNKRLRSRVMGLAFFDYRSGQSVLVAELKDCVGHRVGKNQIIYNDAFTDIKAAIRYTYTKAGFEQDVILRERLPLPEEFGLNPNSTRLEVWTEFIDPPEPVREQQVRKRWLKAKEDAIIDFGAMQIGHGSAFRDGEMDNRRRGITISKEWVVLEGRTFLVEDVSFRWITPHLRALQNRGQAAVKKPSPDSVLFVVSTNRLLAKVQPANTSDEQMQIASVSASEPGFVLDYTIVNSSANYTFEGDKTYHVTGPVNLTGTTTIEGGAVVKFNVGGQINIMNTVQCKTAPYRPAIFTAKDDNTYGENIPGSTGTPSGKYAAVALSLQNGGNLSYIRVLYAKEAVYSRLWYEVKHSQFVRCGWGLVTDHAGVAARNILMNDVGTNFHGRFYTAYTEHLTTHRAVRLNDDWEFQYYDVGSGESQPSSTVTLVNSLIAEVDDNGVVPLWENHVGRPAPGSVVFQTVGAGAHYLANGSPYRNAGGIASVDFNLRNELKQKTTFPPQIVSTDVTVSTTLPPQATRDTDTLDLGYHYDPIDYAANYIWIRPGVNFKLVGGAVLATYGASAGVRLIGGGRFESEGTPAQPNTLIRYTSAQEQPVWWARIGHPSWSGHLWDLYYGGEVILRFTEISWLGHHPNFRRITSELSGTLRINDSEIYGGAIWLWTSPQYEMNVEVRNSLWWRNSFSAQDYDETEYPEDPIWGYAYVSLYNNLFVKGSLAFYHGFPGTDWVVQDNAFDNITAAIVSDQWIYHSHNGYINTPVLPDTQGDDVSLSSFSYQAGPAGTRGAFYHGSTGFRDKGSRTAAAAGLYHFTTQADQVKDSAEVDIGYHYVAFAAGKPLDMDNDGLTDYQEDSNGNGSQDAGEPSLVLIDSDYDGRNDGQEYNTDGTDPGSPTSVASVMLGYWRFNTNIWVGEQGQLPKFSTNVQISASWSGSSALVNWGSVARLAYRDVEVNQSPNINCRNGTVRFWFKPNWSSSTTNNGTGPQTEGRLLELGMKASPATDGWWGLMLNTNGTMLSFQTQTNGSASTNFAAAISWCSNYWRQIALTYSGTNSALYIDGQPVVTTGLPVLRYPSLAVRAADGFSLGSNKNGSEQAKGQFDELETFNYPKTADQILTEYNTALNGDNDGDGVVNHQDADPNDPAVGKLFIRIDLPRNGATLP